MIETSLFKGVSWEAVRGGIYRCLAGLSYGADMLSAGLLANPLVGDLAAVYFFRMQEDMAYLLPPNTSPGSLVGVTKKMAKEWGVTLEDLEAAARENDDSYCLAPMEELIAGMIFPQGASQMVVVTKPGFFLGSGIILSEPLQQEITERFPEGCYCLPSSIHEWIVLSRRNMDPCELKKIVCQVNRTAVKPEDLLSDHVYTLEGGKLQVAA